jgi:undecaprenyl-diphosphatase
MEELNRQLFLNINQYVGNSHFIDLIMILIAKSMPYFFIGILFYLWFTNRRNESLYAGYATTLGVGINQIIGFFYFHPRPFMENLGTTLLAYKPENSFPSDHTTFTLSIALMLISFKSTRILGVVLSVFALWCRIARIYTGVHWPFDIAGSVITSSVAVIIILLLKSKLMKLNDIIINLWDKIFKAVK